MTKREVAQCREGEKHLRQVGYKVVVHQDHLGDICRIFWDYDWCLKSLKYEY